MDEEYYDRVSRRLSLMKDGDSFSVASNTKPETKEKFLIHFSMFAKCNNSEYRSWIYDDEKEVIQYIESVKLRNMMHPMLKDFPNFQIRKKDRR